MAYWLVKTEPRSYSWDDLVRDRRAVWDGITNALALKHLRAATRGDLAFVYHTGDERRIMGIAKIVKGAYADPKLKDPRLAVVDLAPVKPLSSPVSLERMRSEPSFAAWELLRISRLSFVPVPEPIWDRILVISGA